MLKSEVLEEMLVEAMNSAVDRGFLLVCNEWGVKWNATTGLWTSDDENCSQPSCDVFGALLLLQPALDSVVHQGDPDRAARMLVDPGFYSRTVEPDLETLLESNVYEVCRNITNGWDNEEFLGGDEAAYETGVRLANMYRPLAADILELSRSETRMRVAPVSGVELTEIIEITHIEAPLASAG